MSEIVVFDVDPHQPRRLGILGGGAHRLPDARAGDEPGERDHQRDRDRDREHVGTADDHAEDREHGLVLVDQVVDAGLVAAEPQQADVLQDEREARPR